MNLSESNSRGKAKGSNTHLEVFDEKAPGRVVDHSVECIRVHGQRVVVVKAIDVHFRQADLVVRVNGRRVDEVTGTWWNQV